jgi:hypothetical protein
MFVILFCAFSRAVADKYHYICRSWRESIMLSDFERIGLSSEQDTSQRIPDTSIVQDSSQSRTPDCFADVICSDALP